MSEKQFATAFFVTYGMVFISSVIAFGFGTTDGGWSWIGATFGALWGLLCLPGHIIVFSLIDKLVDRL